MQNGRRVTEGKILSLGSLTPNVTTINVERDGELVELRAYFYDDSIPLGRKSRIAKAYEEFRNEVGFYDGKGQFIMRQDVVAMGEFVKNVLDALIDGLEEEELEVLASNDEKSTEVLMYLKYWSDEKKEDEDTGEVVSEQS